MLILHARERLLQTQRLLLHGFEEAWLEHDCRAPHSRRPSPADCRRTSSRACRGSCPWRPLRSPAPRPAGKPPPIPLATAMMSGVMPAHSWANSLPVRPMPRLHLVENQQQAMLVAQRTQALQELGAGHVDAALALHRLDHDRRRFRPDRGLGGGEVAERHMVEAFDRRPEAFEVFRVAAGGEGRQRAAVEGAAEGDDAPALRVARRRNDSAARP